MTPAFYIALTVADPSKALLKGWLAFARDHLPSGTMTTMPHEGRVISLVTEKTDMGLTIMVPLTRHLTASETEAFVQELEQKCSFDFEIAATSDIPPASEDTAQAVVDRDAYLALCTQWAKRQHESWLADRTANGWRYGTEISFSDKTHPLLKNWSELPEQFRKIDPDAPQELLKLLNDQGYAVISQHELRSMLLLMKP